MWVGGRGYRVQRVQCSLSHDAVDGCLFIASWGSMVLTVFHSGVVLGREMLCFGALLFLFLETCILELLLEWNLQTCFGKMPHTFLGGFAMYDVGVIVGPILSRPCVAAQPVLVAQHVARKDSHLCEEPRSGVRPRERAWRDA